MLAAAVAMPYGNSGRPPSLVKVQIQPHQRCDVGFVRQPAGAAPTCFGDTLRYGVKDQDFKGQGDLLQQVAAHAFLDGGGDSVGLGFQASCEGVAQLRFQRLNTTHQGVPSSGTDQ